MSNLTAKEYAEKYRGRIVEISTEWVGKVIGYDKLNFWVILDIPDLNWSVLAPGEESDCVMFEPGNRPGKIRPQYCPDLPDEPAVCVGAAKSAPRCPKCGSYNFYRGFSDMVCGTGGCNPTLR